MGITSKFSTLGAIAVLAMLTGCAVGPHPEVDAGKFGTVHTVTVVYPGKMVYTGGSASAPLAIPGIGLIGAAIAGAVKGIANASVSKAPATFDQVVTAKLGDTKLSRQFTNGVEATLRAHGYEVSEVDASAAGLPTITHDEHGMLHAQGPVYQGSDAVLFINVSPEYFAPGPLNSYARVVVGEIVMFKSDTHDAVFRYRFQSRKFSDPYSYATFASLVQDLPRAIKGLDESVMAQVGLFGQSLDIAQR
ncbi:hypothetical protein [Burkholderia gladioli]|uniref:hypothetical protein n=1 Tax=Burkholderia gladioli TaxID=28095 RepID=UPI0016413C91|nr:hypothetical protein [Burkholderia gladioli]